MSSKDDHAEVISDLTICLDYDGYSEGIYELVSLIREVSSGLQIESDRKPTLNKSRLMTFEALARH